ncbi:DUF4345 domain-containing protein [Winogradskyella sp.]|uniref:DUF4345 domain-containing protein n=1 Tax=Winogradskyella sp. TaxID=1883156 RepID=UPI003F6B6C05
MTKDYIISRVHLIISEVIVIPAAILYGFNPDAVLDIQLKTIDEENFFKAVMGLYLAFSVLWLLGILNSKFIKSALISNVIFMLGLGSGGLFSMLLDGMPTIAFSLGMFGELALGFYGLWVTLKEYSKKP